MPILLTLETVQLRMKGGTVDIRADGTDRRGHERLERYTNNTSSNKMSSRNPSRRMWLALKRAVCCVGRSAHDLVSLLGLFRQKHRLDVGQYTALGDCDARQELVQLLVVADGELQVTGDDPRLLVVVGGVSCQLENLGGQILHDGTQVDGRTGSDAWSIVALAQMTVNTADGELKSGTRRTSLGLSLRLSTFTASRHDCSVLMINKRMTKSGALFPFIGQRRAERAARLRSPPNVRRRVMTT